MIKIEEEILRNALRMAWAKGNRITYAPHDAVHDEIREVHVGAILKSLTAPAPLTPGEAAENFMKLARAM